MNAPKKTGMPRPLRPIPVAAARAIADRYGYDQVIVIARRVGEPPAPHGEHVTTYGRDEAHCGVAARVGSFIKARIMGWPEAQAGPISDRMLACMFQLYDDALDKARAGRVFANPAKPGSLEARAWDMGTERGKELGADARAQQQGGGNA